MDATVNAKPSAPRLHFEPFTLDLHRAELTRAGVPVALRPKAMTLLKHLVASAGRAVSKEELIDAVWPDAVVTDDSLTQCMAELRAALGDRGQQIIKTLPRLGYRFDLPVNVEAMPSTAPLSAPASKTRARRPAVWAGAALIALLALTAVGLALWPSALPPLRIDPELAAQRSIAVMPFTDLSDPKAPHVAQAVDNDLITDLGRLRDIKVIARESTAALGSSADVDVKRVGRELDVRHVLTGSVRREGEHLAISVRLIRTDTGAMMWAERFDYPSLAEWSGRRDITARLAGRLDSRLYLTVLEREVRKPPSDGAVDHWMRGMFQLTRYSTQSELMEARAHFEAALAAQPDSPNALAGLAGTHIGEVMHRWSKDPKASLATAKSLARGALKIDANHSLGLKMLSGVLQFSGEIDDAMMVTRQHLEVNPNDAHANRDLAAILMRSGRWEEALQQVDVAQRLDPLNRQHLWKCHSIRARTLIALHRYDEAATQARLGTAADASIATSYFLLASAEAHRGNLDAARQSAAELLKRQPNFTIAKLRASSESKNPAYLASMEHIEQGLRLAGLPE